MSGAQADGRALGAERWSISCATWPPRSSPTAGGGAPVLDITVSSNSGKRVEKVSITKQGDTYFAKRENEPSIYELDGKAVEDLQKAASDVKHFQPPKKK